MFRIGKLVWVKQGSSCEVEGVIEAIHCDFTVDSVIRHDGVRVRLESSNQVETVAPESLRRRNRKIAVTPGSEDKKPAAKRRQRKTTEASTNVCSSTTEVSTESVAKHPKIAKTSKQADKNKKRSPQKLIIHKNSSSEDEESAKRPSKKTKKITLKATTETAVRPVAPQENGPEDSDDDLDRPFTVEYSPSSRATCRRCDQVIAKGEVRVSHVPLFRGKPGFRIYRHLNCTMFFEQIQSAEDVGGWRKLTSEDLLALAKRVDECKIELEQENQEMQPDELVQVTFLGETREAPVGLTAALLPFQVEGTSWMYHQEVKVPEIRGGILADEMGMGKTIQTLATILDNRPLLQHSAPGCKHHPSAHDFQLRKSEEELWNKCANEWEHEMRMNDIPDSSLPKNIAKARAGTLVICPVIALMQWKSEIEKFTENDTLSVAIYHGPNRASETPPAMLQKYDVVLTTYQVLEQDFRKMISPNKVTCPNCGGKFKIDKLKVHLKYFCGETAQRTEAQSRQRRSADGHHHLRGSNNKKKKVGKTNKANKKFQRDENIPSCTTDKNDENDSCHTSSSEDKMIMLRQRTPATSMKKGKIARKLPVTRSKKRATLEEITSDGSSPRDLVDKCSGDESTNFDDRHGPSRSRRLSRQAASIATKMIASNAQFCTATTSSNDDDSSIGEDTKCDPADETSLSADDVQSMTSSDESESESELLVEVREKQRKAMGKVTKKGGNKKKFADEKVPLDESEDDNDPLEGIDMNELVLEAMSGAKFSPLHTFCWWRIILDEAHYIKSRSSQTAAAAFSLTSIHRWCLSGTPLQNRVSELYSLIRFLRIEPMAYYFCRQKGCSCKSIHYRMHDGKCKDCGHRPFSHYAHFNKYVLNPIQREGYTGDGRRAMFKLKDEVLDKCLLRRTKETKAADMNLPPRLVTIRPVKLHPVEEDFYNALYMDTKSQFDDYIAEGTIMNNYAHIFDLLTKMRQAVDHPYLIIHSKKNVEKRRASGVAVVTNDADLECGICGELPTERILSGCCNGGFCRLCVIEFLTGVGSSSTPCPRCREPFTVDLNQAAIDVAPEAKAATEAMPLLKDMPHVQSNSILRRLNLADFATSTKIEVLVQELVEMRRERPGSKVLVFSQFVNMLDLIRWRIHSDPHLSEMGLGVRILHGGMDVKSRSQALKDFREDPHVRILLMSLKAGGVALNLTVASEVFLVDNWWNPAAEMQAIDRTHRLGQHRPIRATRFIAVGTVEERVLQLQEKKRLVFDGTVGRDAGSLVQLQVDDMKALFA